MSRLLESLRRTFGPRRGFHDHAERERFLDGLRHERSLAQLYFRG